MCQWTGARKSTSPDTYFTATPSFLHHRPNHALPTDPSPQATPWRPDGETAPPSTAHGDPRERAQEEQRVTLDLDNKIPRSLAQMTNVTASENGVHSSAWSGCGPLRLLADDWEDGYSIHGREHFVTYGQSLSMPTHTVDSLDEAVADTYVMDKAINSEANLDELWPTA